MKLDDFLPTPPNIGPPLPRFLNIKWPGGQSETESSFEKPPVETQEKAVNYDWKMLDYLGEK